MGGVPAYSTLGHIADPLLNTVIGYSELDLAALIFHELAHQVAYDPRDSSLQRGLRHRGGGGRRRPLRRAPCRCRHARRLAAPPHPPHTFHRHAGERARRPRRAVPPAPRARGHARRQTGALRPPCRRHPRPGTTRRRAHRLRRLDRRRPQQRAPGLARHLLRPGALLREAAARRLRRLPAVPVRARQRKSRRAHRNPRGSSTRGREKAPPSTKRTGPVSSNHVGRSQSERNLRLSARFPPPPASQAPPAASGSKPPARHA